MEENGVWRTVGGRRIFIKEGQDLASAMKESGKFPIKQKSEADELRKKQEELQIKFQEAENFQEKIKIKSQLNEIEDKIYDIEMKEWDERNKKQSEKESLENIVKKMENKNFEGKIKSKIKTEDEERQEIKNKITSEVEKKAQEQSDKLYKNISKDSKEALDYYTQDGYYDINDYLKGNYDDYEQGPEVVKQIDKAISDYKMEEDYVLYRGVNKDALKNLSVGDNYNPKEYLSTSLNEKIGVKYAEDQGRNGALIKINASKNNTEGIFIGVNSASYYDESEFLLKHNSNMKVVKIYKNENGITTYEMEVIKK